MGKSGGRTFLSLAVPNLDFRRPVLVVQADSFNLSRIQTVIVAAITTNLKLAEAPGNVLLPARSAGLPPRLGREYLPTSDPRPQLPD